MIANANYGGAESLSQSASNATGMSSSYRSSPSMSFRNFDEPINLFKEDEFFPEEVCKKSIRMEGKRFVPPVVTRINRGRG